MQSFKHLAEWFSAKLCPEAPYHVHHSAYLTRIVLHAKVCLAARLRDFVSNLLT